MEEEDDLRRKSELEREHFKVVTGCQKMEEEADADCGQEPSLPVLAMGRAVFSVLCSLSSPRPSAVLSLFLESCTYPCVGSA